MRFKRLLVTGGAGFIGSALVRRVLQDPEVQVCNLDKLSFPATGRALAAQVDAARYRLEVLDIAQRGAVEQVVRDFQPDAVLHLAAESHVDKSIAGAAPFIDSNIVGTFALLEAVRAYWQDLAAEARAAFRVLHVSTDEVYGSLEPDEPAFTETTPQAPNSPYAASKAASDHLARAWGKTYGLPVLITHCSNNYGPYQYPEKLIPLVILRALAGEPLPVYGDGLQVRDWLYVDDHVDALLAALERGSLHETYNIGGGAEWTNLAVVQAICALLDERLPAAQPRRELIRFVADRPGHDRRYAIDSTRIRTTLGWRPQQQFATGLASTVDWYLQHGDWVRDAQDGDYSAWIAAQYAQRMPATTASEADA